MYKPYLSTYRPSKIALPLAMKALSIAGIAAVVAAPLAADAGTLTWNFTYANSLSATVTVEADPPNPLVLGTVYNITSISGTIGGYTITGLSSFNSATNAFKYDPSGIFTDSDGVSFLTNEPLQPGPGFVSWNLYNSLGTSPGIYGIADTYETTSPSTNPLTGAIIEPGPPAPAPGPLPIFGASAAFGVSRRLRRRLLASQLR